MRGYEQVLRTHLKIKFSPLRIPMRGYEIYSTDRSDAFRIRYESPWGVMRISAQGNVPWTAGYESPWGVMSTDVSLTILSTSTVTNPHEGLWESIYKCEHHFIWSYESPWGVMSRDFTTCELRYSRYESPWGVMSYHKMQGLKLLRAGYESPWGVMRYRLAHHDN